MSVEIKGLGGLVKEFNMKQGKIKTEKKRLLFKVGDSTIRISEGLTPVKTGALKRSYKYKVGENQVRIWNSSKYYKFIDEGTRSHIVKPKKKGVLRFKVGGKLAYSKGHVVKGIKAYKITDKTVDKLMGGTIKAHLKVFLKNISKK